MNDTASQRRRSADYWNKPAAVAKRARWWNWPRIVAFQNERICGERLTGWGAGLTREIARRFPYRTFRRAVSVGCGNGVKELALLQSGLVRHFDLFEISEARIERGKARFAKAGFAEHATWHSSDGIEALERGPRYDLITWDNALHHMPDTTRAVAASAVALRSGGVFVMNDYVGVNRFQWSARELAYASAVRRNLPDRFRRDPLEPEKTLAVEIERPDAAQMIASDPSEAADSESILAAIRTHLPNPSIWMLGGAIYHLALNDVLANFDPEHDDATLEALLLLETALIDLGESQYAACIASLP